MKKILLDFKNRVLAIWTDEQENIEYMWDDIQKSIMKEYIPKSMYMQGDNFTFDFEDNKIWINDSVDCEPLLYTLDMFVPKEAHEYPDLDSKFNEIISKLGYAEVQWNERRMDYLNITEFLTGLIK